MAQHTSYIIKLQLFLFSITFHAIIQPKHTTYMMTIHTVSNRATRATAKGLIPCYLYILAEVSVVAGYEPQLAAKWLRRCGTYSNGTHDPI